MPNTIVRINEIEIINFKNTKRGKIQMPSLVAQSEFSDKADILGIYGANGSGKTSIIEAMGFVQTLLTGRPLPETIQQYIRKGEDSCEIKVKFSINGVDVKTKEAEYSIVVELDKETNFKIRKETLSAIMKTEGKADSKKTIIEFDAHASKPEVFTPKYRYEELTKSNVDLKVAVRMASVITEKDDISFIFGDSMFETIKLQKRGASKDYANIVISLKKYASVDLFVITNAHSGFISLNSAIPVFFRLNIKDGVAKGDIMISLESPTVISTEEYNFANHVIDGMNVVLKAIIPNHEIELYNYGDQLLPNGENGYKVELVSIVGDTRIPLRYESEGIIKIISILNLLMCIYNNPSTCLIIDELDSAIFEYLLGEILTVLNNNAKGQMIFTAHNLRALEMMDKDNIYFSTTNSENRYIKFQNVKNNNNLRSMYIRSIVLGGQKEEVYNETDNTEIARAFRTAKSGEING